MDKECSICYDTLDTKITLKCGHEFHYKCIFTTYNSAISKNSRNPRLCPFCRNFVPKAINTMKKSPEKFAPQYGGYCAIAMSEGAEANPNPKSW